MDIRISIENRQPPTGTIGLAGASTHPFAGWLQLLRVLSDLVGGPQGVRSGELDPRSDAELGQDVRHVGVNRVP